MLKSTYKPSPAALAAAAPLLPGWSEHKAPTGHTYYYHAETKSSTYKRPGVPVAEPGPAPAPSPYAHLPNLSDPRVANAYLAQLNPPPPPPPPRHGPAGRGGLQARPRPQPTDKPRRKEAIPGCEPWLLVYTKYSRRFVYNPVNKASYWRIPEKLMPGILELDKARIRDKASVGTQDDEAGPRPRNEPVKQAAARLHAADSSDEYEEVDVTDDEDGDEAGGDEVDGERRSKRRRTGDDGQDAQDDTVEFTEADIAAQLQLMGDDYGLEPGDYDDGNMDNWPDGTAGVDFSDEDAKWLFKDLLNDFSINPYSPWDKLLEEARILQDARYTALATTRARKECWDEWCREKITELKEQRAKQEKKDPKVAYMAFLQEKATPKLYWPEFRRKYKKEEPIKDMRLPDKDREKAYREHVNRLKLPQATLKSDLTALLKAQPLHLLHRKSLSGSLPTAVLTDIRYISLEPGVRDSLVEAYVQSLPPPPDDAAAAERDEDRKKERDARERRERALQERNQAVEDQKRRRERDVAASKARLRQGEREIEMAMRVDKRGLQKQLAREHAGEGESEDKSKG